MSGSSRKEKIFFVLSIFPYKTYKGKTNILLDVYLEATQCLIKQVKKRKKLRLSDFSKSFKAEILL